MRFSAVLCVILFICFGIQPSTLLAQAESEGASNSYLLRPVGARTIGLAGAYTSNVNEPNAVFCNTGALATLSEDVQASTMFSVLSFGRSQNTLAITKNLGSSVGVGLLFNSISNPGFQRYDAGGNALGTATFQQYCVGAALGTKVSTVGFGAAVKYLVNNVPATSLKATGLAFDLGTKLPFARYFNLGLAVQNIGSVQWNNGSSTSEQLPWVLRCGLSTEIPISVEEVVQRSTTLGESDTLSIPSPRYVLLALEADYTKSAACPHIALASEYAITELLSIRAGIGIVGDQFGAAVFMPMNVYSGGLSYRIHSPDLPFDLQLDYAIAHEWLASNSVGHHFSLTCGF